MKKAPSREGGGCSLRFLGRRQVGFEEEALVLGYGLFFCEAEVDERFEVPGAFVDAALNGARRCVCHGHTPVRL